MKKRRIISLLLCFCLLLPLVSACDFDLFGGNNSGGISFAGVEHSYGGATNADGTTGGNQYGAVISGDGGIVSNGVSSGMNIGVTAPAAGDILAIAKKYYDYHSAALNGELKGEFTRDAGAVTFDGKSNDAERSESLCTTAAVIAMLEGDGDYAVGCAAAAVGWSQGYARGAGTLAAMLETAGFVTDKDRLDDAVKLAVYAIALDKNDADFYVTLGRALYRQNDLDGALEAVEAALVLEPGNSAAINLKIEILFKKGGYAFTAAQKKDIGDNLKENDGELSKRITEQEKAAEGIKPHEIDRSKAEYLQNLRDLYELEAITPSDMTDAYFPAQSQQLREKILTLTEEDKNLRLPEFPADLVSSGRVAAHNEKNLVLHEYVMWEFNQRDIANDKYRAIKENTPKDGRYIDYHDLSPVDCMILYNEQVYKEALRNFFSYVVWIWQEDIDPEMQRLADAGDPKLKELRTIYENSHEEEDRIRFYLASNEYIENTIEAIVPLHIEWYNTVREEAERLWEEMLPFARCTRYPEVSVAELYSDLVDYALYPLGGVTLLYYNTNSCGNYDTDLSYADLQSAADALAKATSLPPYNEADPLNGFTISFEFGPFEFKLSSNKIEIEYVNGSACKASFDWKSKELEVGVGVGYKAKVGTIKGAQVGVEAKAYVNFVIDVKNNEVSDIYVSAEAKGTAGSLEAGGQARVSLFGKGAGLSSQVKPKLKGFAIEHEAELIKTG